MNGVEEATMVPTMFDTAAPVCAAPDGRGGLVCCVLRRAVGIDREGEDEARADEDEKAQKEPEKGACGVHANKYIVFRPPARAGI